MGIDDRDYMRRSPGESSVRMSQKRSSVSLLARMRFKLWLIIRQLTGRR